jgi:hypothetical protein
LQWKKNDLTTGAWQQDIGCLISIVLLSTSDVMVTAMRVAGNKEGKVLLLRFTGDIGQLISLEGPDLKAT